MSPSVSFPVYCPLFILPLYSDVTRETSRTPWKISERRFMFKLQIKQTYVFVSLFNIYAA